MAFGFHLLNAAMAEAMYFLAKCARCDEADKYLYGVQAELDVNVNAHVLMCRDCIRDLVRINDTTLAQDRHSLLTEDSTVVRKVYMRRQGEEEEVLRPDYEEFYCWLGHTPCMPTCTFCETTEGYHVYAGVDKMTFPIFTSCRACLRGLIIANASLDSSSTQLFALVVRRIPRIPFRSPIEHRTRAMNSTEHYECLAWGSTELTAFLAADYEWAERMRTRRTNMNRHDAGVKKRRIA